VTDRHLLMQDGYASAHAHTRDFLDWLSTLGEDDLAFAIDVAEFIDEVAAGRLTASHLDLVRAVVDTDNPPPPALVAEQVRLLAS
jgi:hypothetical protein